MKLRSAETTSLTKQERIDAALEEARRLAYQPIEGMNRQERRTKVGRIMQKACEMKLRNAVLVILKAAEGDTDD